MKKLMDNEKSILLHCRKPPYGNSLSREAVDIALATAAFDQQLAVLFSGDGVWQLASNQNSEGIHSKNHGKALSVLPLYDIDNIYVDSHSLEERNLKLQDLILEAQPLNTKAIQALSNSCDSIFNF